jgi:hypothetical protein
MMGKNSKSVFQDNLVKGTVMPEVYQVYPFPWDGRLQEGLPVSGKKKSAEGRPPALLFDRIIF